MANNREYWMKGRNIFDQEDIWNARVALGRKNIAFKFSSVYTTPPNVVIFTAEPCGPIAFSVELRYDLAKNIGWLYMYPRFIYSGNIVSVDAEILLDSSKESFAEYIRIASRFAEEMHDNISVSNKSDEGLVFDFSTHINSKILTRIYDDRSGKVTYKYQDNDILLDTITIEPKAYMSDDNQLPCAYVTDVNDTTNEVSMYLRQELD